MNLAYFGRSDPLRWTSMVLLFFWRRSTCACYTLTRRLQVINNTALHYQFIVAFFVYFRDYSLKLLDHTVVFPKAMFTRVPLPVFRQRATTRTWRRLRGLLDPCSCFVQRSHEHCALDLFRYYTTHVVHDSLQMKTKGGCPPPLVLVIDVYGVIQYQRKLPFVFYRICCLFTFSLCGICPVCWPRFNRRILPFSLDL